MKEKWKKILSTYDRIPDDLVEEFLRDVEHIKAIENDTVPT